jgi:phosphoglycerate kinase
MPRSASTARSRVRTAKRSGTAARGARSAAKRAAQRKAAPRKAAQRKVSSKPKTKAKPKSAAKPRTKSKTAAAKPMKTAKVVRLRPRPPAPAAPTASAVPPKAATVVSVAPKGRPVTPPPSRAPEPARPRAPEAPPRRPKTLDDIQVRGKRVLLRADLNVPVKDGIVTDATRLERLAPTILQLADLGARVIVISHFDRPKGKRVPTMSLRPVMLALSRVLERPVFFGDDCVGPVAESAVTRTRPGDILVLENLRFHPGEEENDRGFARELARLGDIYVNDAFSAAHRAHASTEALAHLLPAAAGRLMQAELEALSKALEAPARPLAAIVGGAKVSTKLDLLGNLINKVDMLVIGGAMANTFLFALGTDVGKSLCERDMAETARAILGKADAAGCEIVLPKDVVVAAEFKEGAPSDTVPVGAVPRDRMILDVGPASAHAIAQRLGTVKTLVWNGPLGAFETPPFDAATNLVARAVAELTRARKLLSVAGGGDTVAALGHAGVADDLSYVSTAGGAFLEWLEGKDLPGVKALL